MSDIWSIIGISSLVASIVTVVLGIIRDFVVEKYRFKRESEAGYIQSQVQLYSRIYFCLKRLSKGRGRKVSELLGRWEEEVKELNETMKAKADLLEQRVLDEWFTFWLYAQDYKKETDKKRKEELNKLGRKHSGNLFSIVKDTMNRKLIPKYRKIVGDTVPDLD